MSAPNESRTRSDGNPPPVLLVHGIGSTFEHNWARSGWVDRLRARGREVLAAHLPGHGPDANTETAGGSLPAAVLAAVGDHPQVDAVGFSAGGFSLVSAAVREPSRFRRLAILAVGDGMLNDNPVARMDLARAVAAVDERDNKGARVMRGIIRSAGNDIALVTAQMGSQRIPVTDAQLAGLAAPTLVVMGDQDFAGPSNRLLHGLPDARLLTLPGVNHNGTTSDPLCIQSVLDFLDEPMS
jgi:pimeloyl-ACP methyl ester carboxylesterase